MSANPFEKKIGDWLRAVPRTFVYHPTDIPQMHLWAPCDFMVVIDGRFVAIECKEVSNGGPFPLSRWTPQQRQMCDSIRRAGGRYVLLVGFKLQNRVAAYEIPSDPPRGSLQPDDGYAVTKSTIAEILWLR